jgi:mannonate dehydratase
MRRRDFFEMGATLAVAQATPAPRQQTRPAAPRRALMKLGTQHGDSDDILRVMAAFGVSHICSSTPSNRLDEKWSVEGLMRLRERVEQYGIKLEMVPFPTSAYITQSGFPNVMLGKSPERDREIEQACQMIRNVARAGIPAIKYNLTILGVVRTQPTPGRGGALYSSFDYSKARQQPPLTEAGVVSEDAHWERISYFLQRVVPVAEEYKVKLACHPHDPPMPRGRGFRGVQRAMGTVEGLKRFIGIRPSPYHGLNFCQGTVCEMLENPAQEIFDVIRYFGARQKIFNVHFRNIKGRFLNFQETFPDDGDINMIQAMRVYREVGYDGMIMPDHAPHIPGDQAARQAFAFEFGYIAALIQLVNQEA